MSEYDVSLEEFESTSNYIFEFRLFNSEYSIKGGFDRETKEWFISLRHLNSVIDSNYNRKYMLKNTRLKSIVYKWIKDTECTETNPNKAVILLMKKISDSFEKCKKAVASVAFATTVTTFGGLEKKKNIFWDSKMIPQKLSLSLGEHTQEVHLKGRVPIFYFGVKVPCEVKEATEKGITTQTIMQPILVTSINTYIEPTEQWASSENIILKQELTQCSGRWNLEKIDLYLHNLNEEVKPKETFELIRSQYERYIEFEEPELYDLLALWDLGTYLHTIFQAYPYINLWGFKNSGKSKVMLVSRNMSFNGLMVVDPSPAVIFRTVDNESPTLYFEEAENLWQKSDKGEDDTSEIVALCNAGWQNGAEVARLEKEAEKFVPKMFKVYCPKMFASIKGLKGALQTRCIEIVMVRANKESGKGDLWPDPNHPKYAMIRNDCYLFALKYWIQIKARYSGQDGIRLKKEFNLSNRDWQIWNPLLVIAYIIDKELYQRIGKFAERYTRQQQDDEENEDSWDYIVQQEMLTNWCRSDVPVKCYVSDLKHFVDSHFVDSSWRDAQGNDVVKYKSSRPGTTWIGRLLNKLGFKQFRHRDDRVYYLLNKKIIFSLLSRAAKVVTVVANATDATDLFGINSESSSIIPTRNIDLNIYIEEQICTNNPQNVNKIGSDHSWKLNRIKNIIDTLTQSTKTIYLKQIIETCVELKPEEIEEVLNQLKFIGVLSEPKPGIFERIE